MFVVWYLCDFNRLHNLHPWYWNSLLYSLNSGENAAFAHFAAATANHYNLAFSFHQVLIIAAWTEVAWYVWVDLPDTSTHGRQRESNSDQWLVVIHPSTNRARRCLTSLVWRKLVTTQPCAITRLPVHFTWVMCLSWWFATIEVRKLCDTKLLYRGQESFSNIIEAQIQTLVHCVPIAVLPIGKWRWNVNVYAHCHM